MKKTLFLHPPSFDGFDGGAGSRYQARRRSARSGIRPGSPSRRRSFPGSRLIDAPARGLALKDLLPLAGEYELAVLHTSTPSFRSGRSRRRGLRLANPELRVGFVGAHVAVSPEDSLRASEAIDFVAREEFDYTIQEIAAGRPLASVDGVSYRHGERIVHNPPRATIENMDALPFVMEVYKRDLVIEDYFIGYLLHPYVSLYTGRGCRSKCSFCLWPQTIGGHRYRTRSPQSVADEIALGKSSFRRSRSSFSTTTRSPTTCPRPRRSRGCCPASA